jgi:hypothetical protein
MKFMQCKRYEASIEDSQHVLQIFSHHSENGERILYYVRKMASIHMVLYNILTDTALFFSRIPRSKIRRQ